MLIDKPIGKLSSLGAAVCSVDPLELTADQRARPHFRKRTAAGVEVIVSLPRGSHLDDGDVLCLDNGVAVVVRAAPEDLLEVTPRTAREWGVVGYQLGNLHRDVRFQDECLLTPYEHSTEQVLASLGVPCSRITRSFTGARYGAYTGHDQTSTKYVQGRFHSHGSDQTPHQH